TARSNDGNAFFFVAYIYYLLNRPEEDILRLIEEAKEKGLREIENVIGPNLYPEIGIEVLRAELYIKKSDFKLAAENFYSAAEHYRWAGNSKQAEVYYERTIEVAPSHSLGCWNLADQLHARSYISSPPYQDETLLRRAFDVWYSPEDKIVRDRENFWAYSVAAFIHEGMAKFTNEDEYLEHWTSACYGERALLLGNENLQPWTNMSRSCRNLGLEKNGFKLLEIATLMDFDEDLALLEEKTLQYINAGYNMESRPLLKKLINKRELELYKAWEGYLDFYTGDLDSAIDILSVYRNKDKNDIWGALMLMLSHWCKFNMEEAKVVAYDIVSSKESYGYRKEKFKFGCAHFVLNEMEDALNSFNDFFDDTGDELPGSDWTGHIFLCKHEMEQCNENYSNFHRWMTRFGRRRELEFFLIIARTLKQYFKQGIYSEQDQSSGKLRVLDQWIEKIDSFLKKQPSGNPEIKFDQCIEEYRLELERKQYAAGTKPWIAIHSGIARVKYISGDYQGAKSAYALLIKYEHEFPECKIGLQNCEIMIKAKDDEMHPFIENIQSQVQKRTEEREGKQLIVEDFVLSDVAVAQLKRKLAQIGNAEEQSSAIRSLFAYSNKVAEQGWHNNALKIKEIGKVLSKPYSNLESLSEVRGERKSMQQ
ncbi:MAG: hypothetical protein ACR2MX_18975, partial [Cyclobacteriaceae bacterium]